jgi:hypothetical protein
MIAIAILVVFTVTSGAKFLGLQNLSVESVQTELDSTTASTSQGGSKFSHGSNSLSPIALPNDVATVLFRPFIFEAHSGLLLLAALEGTALIGIVVVRWESIRIGFARCRRWPFLLYLWILLMLYCLFFSAFANFGLLTRERSLILPALYALICIDPALARRQDEIDHAEQAAAVDES